MNNLKKNEAVSEAVDGATYWAVDRAVLRFVNDSVFEAVYGAVDEDPPHPGLQDFLNEIGES